MDQVRMFQPSQIAAGSAFNDVLSSCGRQGDYLVQKVVDYFKRCDTDSKWHQ